MLICFSTPCTGLGYTKAYYVVQSDDTLAMSYVHMKSERSMLFINNSYMYIICFERLLYYYGHVNSITIKKLSRVSLSLPSRTHAPKSPMNHAAASLFNYSHFLGPVGGGPTLIPAPI